MTTEIQKLLEAHPRPWHVGREVDDQVSLYDANDGWICLIHGKLPGMFMPALFIANAMVNLVNSESSLPPRARSFFPKINRQDDESPTMRPSFLENVPVTLDPTLPPGTVRCIGSGGNSATF